MAESRQKTAKQNFFILPILLTENWQLKYPKISATTHWWGKCAEKKKKIFKMNKYTGAAKGSRI